MVLLRFMIGDLLRRLRLSQRRTLRDVAEAARVSVQYLSELERGRKEASSEVLAAVCRALGITLAEFLEQVSRDLRALESGRRPGDGDAVLTTVAEARQGGRDADLIDATPVLLAA